jgi:hypothetical protein
MLMVGRKNSIDEPHVPSSIGMKQCGCGFFLLLLWCSSENGVCGLIIRPLILEIL